MSLKGIILIFEGHLIYVPHIPQVFISELKKSAKISEKVLPPYTQ